MDSEGRYVNVPAHQLPEKSKIKAAVVLSSEWDQKCCLKKLVQKCLVWGTYLQFYQSTESKSEQSREQIC